MTMRANSDHMFKAVATYHTPSTCPVLSRPQDLVNTYLEIRDCDKAAQRDAVSPWWP